MTASEMSYEFDVGYDRITNFDAPGYEPREKSTFLTKAQEDLVVEVQRGNAHSELTKRVLDVLKTDVPILAAAMSAGPYTNSFWADLPTTVYAFDIVNETAVLTPTTNHFYTGQVFSDVKVKPVDDDYYHANIKNPYKKPSHELVWRLDYGENDAGWKGKVVYVIEANQVLTSVNIHYYRKPSPIIIQDANYAVGETLDGVDLNGSHTAADLNCELNKITHRTIVDRAIKLAYAALQDEKGFQISSVQEQK